MVIDPRRNTHLSFFIKFCAWLLLFLIILELFTRGFIIKAPLQQHIPGLGVVPVNNSINVWGVEGYGITHYLSNGEIYTPYQSGKAVVILGDSFTEALQVHDSEKYVSVAEARLQDSGNNLDLHNLGLSGRSIADYVYIAPFIKRLYSPEVVIVQLASNDFTESLNSSRQNYFMHKDSSLNLVHNSDYFTFDLDLQNSLRLSSLGSLLIYKLTPVVKEQRLRIATANQIPEQIPGQLPAVSSSGLNTYEIEMQLDALKNAYDTVNLVILVIPNVPVIQGGGVALNNDDEEFLTGTINEIDNLSLLYPRDEFVELYISHDKFPRGFFNSLPDSGHLNIDGNFVLGIALADYLSELMK